MLEETEVEEDSKICKGIKKDKTKCMYKAKVDGFCGIHAPKKDNRGTSKDRCKAVIVFDNKTYMAGVAGSSKDTGNWKSFWEKHSGEGREYPKTCRIKDCVKKATCTGHMYLRSEWEAGDKKHNYLVPICSHHNSIKYDAPNFVLATKGTVAVKILENK